MDEELTNLWEMFQGILKDFDFVKISEIPDIELYMDQVLTFMDRHLSPYTRDPANDKILTKTMINNYTKNHVLNPPVKKKYDIDQILTLLILYYMKSFLSISDIGRILKPVQENYSAGASDRVKTKKDAGLAAEARSGEKDRDLTGKDARPTFQDVYEELIRDLSGELEDIVRQAGEQFAGAGRSFADFPDEDRAFLQRFDLICRMSAEIYIKKLFIERMLDGGLYEDGSTQET